MEAFSKQKNSNYGVVGERLKQADKFSEAHSVLEIGYKFLQHGFEVTFDPKYYHQQKGRQP
jgi:hypothetical protein